MSKKSYDVAIIGGGPGGYVAAIRASQLGLKTAVIERENLGGICLNWGCIPTKALLRTAEIKHLIDHADTFGLSVKDVQVDLEKVVQRSRDVSSKLTSGIKHLMKKNKIDVFEGTGTLLGKGCLSIKSEKTSEEITAKHIILATGARARELPHLKADGETIWTYRHAMVPKKLPKSLLIIGSGAIGIEFASFYRTLGSDVTVVEVVDRILPVEDEEISKLAQKAFEKQGIKILTNTTVEKVETSKTGAVASLKTKEGKTETLSVEKVILAIGIQSNTENLGLEKTAVKLDRGHIVTDEFGKTAEPGVYAIGDVAGAPWLAHKASHEAVICVEKIAGLPHVHPMKRENIPGCTYSMPQVASVGLTEAKAKEAGYKVKVGRFPFMANGKALAMGESDGLIKTLFDEKTGELLGAHMIGAEVTELIQGFVLGKTLEATEAEFMHTIFPHPTLSEMMHESVLEAFDRALHI